MERHVRTMCAQSTLRCVPKFIAQAYQRFITRDPLGLCSKSKRSVAKRSTHALTHARLAHARTLCINQHNT
eukprot:2238430-Amphidinium_carterae.2